MQLNDSTIGVLDDHQLMTSRELTPITPGSENRPGKFKVIAELGRIRFAVGRNYCQLVPVFCLILTASMFTVQIVQSVSNGPVLKLINVSLSASYILLFLAVVFSDPGSLKNSPNLQPQHSDIVFRHCDYCQLYSDNQTIHCGECGICVREYHHHSTLFGKCIGKDNKNMYQIWRISTYVFIGYVVLCFLGCIVIIGKG